MEPPMFRRATAAMALALFLSLAMGPASAGSMLSTTSCVGEYGAFSCSTMWGHAGDPYTRNAPGPVDPWEQAKLRSRDRKWIARCRPAITRDRYGVSRYYYAARGCEFGAIDGNAN